MRKITILRTSPSLYRLALAWPAVKREIDTPADPGNTDPWAQIKFSFKELAQLADTSPPQTLEGFERLKAFGIINPDGSLAETVEKFFKAEALAAFGIKAKPPKLGKE
jgi:hypothetical protein